MNEVLILLTDQRFFLFLRRPQLIRLSCSVTSNKNRSADRELSTDLTETFDTLLQDFFATLIIRVSAIFLFSVAKKERREKYLFFNTSTFHCNY